MNSMPTTDLEALAFHEGLPGHHLQLSIAAELGDVPDFQRHTRFTAFSEGGACTRVSGQGNGLYQDPYSNFGRSAMELWRAARLVVDTGLHHNSGPGRRQWPTSWPTHPMPSMTASERSNANRHARAGDGLYDRQIADRRATRDG
ncbi:MAG: hypothetical protein CM15mP74_23200 [Halieaceae bacterium]|nr:MAG: hypothetical protein CM15mP74_23200 [Halieaceae bacterium]